MQVCGNVNAWVVSLAIERDEEVALVHCSRLVDSCHTEPKKAESNTKQHKKKKGPAAVTGGIPPLGWSAEPPGRHQNFSPKYSKNREILESV